MPASFCWREAVCLCFSEQDATLAGHCIENTVSQSVKRGTAS
jgi:hypothetical protein